MEFTPGDAGDAAWSRWLAQHEGQADTEAFVRSFYPPLTRLESALHDLLTRRWLDTATGHALDGIGSIVGLTREIPDGTPLPFFGFEGQPLTTGFSQARFRQRGEPYAVTYVMTDAEYRRMLRVKIALNNGRGTVEEIVAACREVFGAPRVIVQDWGNATARVYLGRLISNLDPLHSHIASMIQPRAAGVRFWIGQMHDSRVFGFAGQPFGPRGFGAGVLSRAL